MAQFQTKRIADATLTTSVNRNEFLLKVDENNVLTRITRDSLLSGTDLNCIHTVPGVSMPTNRAVGDYIATPEVAGSQNIRLIIFASPSSESSNMKQGLVLQEVSDRRTTQYMLWNDRIYVRAVHFSDVTRTSVTRVEGWQTTGMPTGFKAEGNVVKMMCVHGYVFGGEIPLASTGNAGLLSSADKELLDKLRAKNLV